MQVLVPDPRADYNNIIHAFYRIIRYEGLRMTLRGISATVYGSGPAHALYYSSYEKVKSLLSRADHSNHIVHGIAGCVATVLHDAIMTPADVVKQRMQVFNSPYKSCLDCVRRVYHAEGLAAFYRSYGTQLTMNIPFVSLHFVIYESAQDLINPTRQYHPLSHVVSGAAAGAVAAAATTPLDVCKTLLNTQGGVHHHHSTPGVVVQGLVQAASTVYRCRGVRGYFSGVTARMLGQSPATAISWTVYEFFKFAITNYTRHHDDDDVSSSGVIVSFVD